MTKRFRLGALLALALTCVLAFAASIAMAKSGNGGRPAAAAAGSCSFANGIEHVIYLQFDNTHYRRDRPNVASDLEQMPHLLSFLQNNGTLFTNDHTILISHTGGGILSSLTGLYPDRQGQTVSNSYRYFKADGTTSSSTSFKYWTDLVDDATGTADPRPNMITDTGKNTPAPWVPYTRAGCDFGGIGTANIELENTGTGPFGDMSEAFGLGSPEWNEAANPATRAQAQTDFVGIAIHCGAGGGHCAGNPDARADRLPDEPGGYAGFQALYGAKYVDPAITPNHSPCVRNTADELITDPRGTCGFPGFDGMLAKNTLGYVAQMQENGVPVTYGYISDAHDFHVPDPVTDAYQSSARGPGERDFVNQLKSYDDAFAAFFQNLEQHGINRSNTLFVVTVDEGDHFAGGIGTPQPDGTLGYSHTACTNMSVCPDNQIGEVNLDLRQATGNSTFTVHNDDAPTVYVTGNPARNAPNVRSLERQLGSLQEPDTYNNHGALTPVAVHLADPVEEKALHMVNADPQRTPTFTLFGNADFFMTAFGTTPACGANPCVAPGFAYNHGDIQEEIGNTWAGLVGPGVETSGVDPTTWTDHTNLRPTILTLLGLRDDYQLDGRVLVEALRTQATPQTLIAHRETVRRLGTVYEQLNASFGQFSADTLTASTRALKSTDESAYESIESSIASLTSQRDALAAQIKAGLSGAAFDGQALNEQQAKSWIRQANALLAQANALAAG
jgi:hypothetical protein